MTGPKEPGTGPCHRLRSLLARCAQASTAGLALTRWGRDSARNRDYSFTRRRNNKKPAGNLRARKVKNRGSKRPGVGGDRAAGGITGGRFERGETAMLHHLPIRKITEHLTAVNVSVIFGRAGTSGPPTREPATCQARLGRDGNPRDLRPQDPADARAVHAPAHPPAGGPAGGDGAQGLNQPPFREK